MTPRERILAAVEHRQPDKVPVDLGATPSSGISAIAYGNLKQHLGITQGATRLYDVVQQLAQPEDFILDRFGVDVVDIGRAFNTETSAWQPTTLADGQAALYPAWFNPERQPNGSFVARMKDGLDIAYMPAGGTFFDQSCFPYVDGYPADFRNLSAEMGRILWAALVHSPWDHAGDPGFWDTLRAKALELRRTSDRGLMIVIGCNLFEWGTFLRRMDNFLMDLAAEGMMSEIRIPRNGMKSEARNSKLIVGDDVRSRPLGAVQQSDVFIGRADAGSDVDRQWLLSLDATEQGTSTE